MGYSGDKKTAGRVCDHPIAGPSPDLTGAHTMMHYPYDMAAA